MCGACIDLILYSTSCFKINARDIHIEKIPVSTSIKLPYIQQKDKKKTTTKKKRTTFESRASPLYKRPAAANTMHYAQHIHVVTIPVHSLYYITSYTKKYGSGQLILILNYRIYSKKPELYRKSDQPTMYVACCD